MVLDASTGLVCSLVCFIKEKRRCTGRKNSIQGESSFTCIVACRFTSGRSSILLTHLKIFPSFDLFKAPLSGH